jgi:hypothetical protein
MTPESIPALLHCLNRNGLNLNSEVSPEALQTWLRGADILVCPLGRLSSRPEAGLGSPALEIGHSCGYERSRVC